MLSLWLVMQSFTFTTFAFFLFIYSAYHSSISAHFLALWSLVLIPTTNVISKNMILGSWLSYLFLQCPELQYFFIFSTLFAFHFIWLSLFFYAFLALTIPDRVSPLLHMSLYFCICAKLKWGIKSVALHFTLQIFLTCFTYDHFSSNYAVLPYVS